MAAMDLKSERELRLLQEIEEMLQRESQLNIRHHSLITEVLKGCEEGILKWHKDNTPRSSLPSTEENGTGDGGERRLSLNSEDGSMIGSMISPRIYQEYAQTLTNKMREDNSKMVENITNLLHESYYQDESEIWGSYEAIFFKSTTVQIDNLYVLAYLSEVTELQRLLPTANPRNMDLTGQWVVDILDPVTMDDEPDTVLDVGIKKSTTVRKRSIKRWGSKRGSERRSYMVKSYPSQTDILEEMENRFPFLRDPEKDLENETEVPTGRSSKGRSLATEPLSFEDIFEQPYMYLNRVLEETSPMVKLQWLVKCLQAFSDLVQEQVSREHVNANNPPFGADDLLPSLMLFLIKANPGQVTALYPQLKFLSDYMPDIVVRGNVGYTVTLFSVAFSAIFQSDVANDFVWCETRDGGRASFKVGGRRRKGSFFRRKKSLKKGEHKNEK